MIDRDRIQSLLMECVREHAEQSATPVQVEPGTLLMGPGAVLDSLGLVMIVTDFEARLNQAFDAQVVLASEKAMSMNHSPFRSVNALSEYAEQLLGESGKA